MLTFSAQSLQRLAPGAGQPSAAPAEHKPDSESLPEGPRLSGQVRISIIDSKPVLEIRLGSFERAHLNSLPKSVIGAYEALVAAAPVLASNQVRTSLYEQAVRLGAEGDLVNLPRVVHRFVSFFNPESGKNIRTWKEQLGTPLILRVCDSAGELLLVRGPDRAPRLSQVLQTCTEGVSHYLKNLLARGNSEKAAQVSDAAIHGLNLIKEAFRLRQLGFSNPDSAQLINEKYSANISADQVGFWVTRGSLPVELAPLVKGSDKLEARAGRLKIPDQASKSFSYLLGVQVGRVSFEGAPEGVGILHPAPQVRARVKLALRNIGIDNFSELKGRPGFGLNQKEVRCRNSDLVGAIYEQTYGYTRLPWSYLLTPQEKKAFVQGITDSMAVVRGTKITLTKANAITMLEELAVLLADLNIYGEISRGEKETLLISSLEDMSAFRKLVGKRYPDFDAKLTQACAPRAKHHASVLDYLRFLRARREVEDRTPAKILERMKELGSSDFRPRVIERWLAGDDPRCAARLNTIITLRDALSYRAEQLDLAAAGTPRSQIIPRIEYGRNSGSSSKQA